MGAMQIFAYVCAADSPAQHLKNNFIRSRFARLRHGLNTDISISMINGGFHLWLRQPPESCLMTLVTAAKSCSPSPKLRAIVTTSLAVAVVGKGTPTSRAIC